MFIFVIRDSLITFYRPMIISDVMSCTFYFSDVFLKILMCLLFHRILSYDIIRFQWCFFFVMCFSEKVNLFEFVHL